MNAEEVTRTGLERFYDRYPNYPGQTREVQPEYLGVGAPMIDPTHSQEGDYESNNIH